MFDLLLLNGHLMDTALSQGQVINYPSQEAHHGGPDSETACQPQGYLLSPPEFGGNSS